MPRYVMFDLDGTLLDSQQGISRCMNHALRQLGSEARDADQLKQFIGPPLDHAFATLLDTKDESLIAQAIEAYRQRFREVGIFESQPYVGIPEMLRAMRGNGLSLWLVTSKPQPFAERLVAHFFPEVHFAAIHGATFDDTRKAKVDVIRHALKTQRVEPTHAVMVGDRDQDILGAKRNGTASIAVLWGYGSEDELVACQPDDMVDRPEALPGTIQRLGAS